MTRAPDTSPRQQILAVADDLFSRRGFAAVKLRDIAGGVGIHHASLYYYVPGGKTQLYVDVMERNLRRAPVDGTPRAAP